MSNTRFNPIRSQRTNTITLLTPFVTQALLGAGGLSVMKPYSSGSGADGTAPESPRAVRDGSVGRKYTAGTGVRFRSGELTESLETLGQNKHNSR